MAALHAARVAASSASLAGSAAPRSSGRVVLREASAWVLHAKAQRSSVASAGQAAGACARRPGAARCSAPVSAAASVAGDVRVRFAPSPTGNLHVGGARTALFNWLLARSTGGKFILRIEDTDLERSTRESEQAVLRDLQWLGLDWDEGPDVGGEFGPYRQSERNEVYKNLAQQLLDQGFAYRCFCTDEELEAMRAEQEAKKLPPKYAGKWARASEAEVAAELEKGTPHTIRFRVPENRVIKINDVVRGEVAWNTDTLGDFVILRSNGQPVYNFCVAVDDASMRISHVVRAEEHLPNTLRQALIYEALGFSMPTFGHVSLILAPDRSKLSKRHGATSVGQFKDMGYLAEAMVNYLALLGWNDGTEEEIFTRDQLVEKFKLDRVTKSAAIFDTAKLRWMNGQHLRAADEAEVEQMLANEWMASGIFTKKDDEVIKDAAALLRNGIELLPDAGAQLKELFTYDLPATLASEEARDVVADGLDEVASAVLAAYDDGELAAAISEGRWQAWTKALGKNLKRKGKRLFMPLRILLTGKMHGPDVGAILALVDKAAKSGAVAPEVLLVPLEERIQALRAVDFKALNPEPALS